LGERRIALSSGKTTFVERWHRAGLGFIGGCEGLGEQGATSAVSQSDAPCTRDDFLAGFLDSDEEKRNNAQRIILPERDTRSMNPLSLSRARSFNTENEKRQTEAETREDLSYPVARITASAPAISAGRPRGHAGTGGERERADDTARGAVVEAGARPQRPPRGKAVEN